MIHCAKMLVHIRRILQETQHHLASGRRALLNVHVPNPETYKIPAHCDSEGVWRAAHSDVRKPNTAFHSAKHSYLVHRQVIRSIDLRVIETKWNVVDMLTKTLPSEETIRHWKSFPWIPPTNAGVPKPRMAEQAAHHSIPTVFLTSLGKRVGGLSILYFHIDEAGVNDDHHHRSPLQSPRPPSAVTP